MFSKMVVIGLDDTLMGFCGTGIDTVKVSQVEEVEGKIAQLKSTGEYAIVFIAERLAVHVMEKLPEWGEQYNLTISVIPDGAGSLGVVRTMMRQMVRRAVGADVFS